MFETVRAMAASVELPLTADRESGYGLQPRDLIARSYEPERSGSTSRTTTIAASSRSSTPERHAQRLAAIKSASQATGVDIVLRARIDVFLHKLGTPAEQLDQAIRRAKLYAQAGADCVYPITLADEHAIRRFVRETDCAVNVYLRPGVASPTRLAELGVARISVGTALHRATSQWVQQAAAELLACNRAPLDVA